MLLPDDCCWNPPSGVCGLPAVALRAEPDGAQNPEGSIDEVQPCDAVAIFLTCPTVASF